MPAAAAWTDRAEAQVGPIETPSHDHARTLRSGASPGRPWSRPRPTATTSASARGDSQVDSDPPGKNSRKRPPFRAGNSQPLRHFCQVKNSFRRSVSRGSFAAAVAAALSLAIAVPAQATTDTLDQSQTLPMSFQRQISFLAQPYTAGRLYVGSTWLTGSQWGEDFAFKTWVAASTNSAPSVAADTAAVNVNEGTAPTNTGTFSDPDGDTVALSASSGAVTKTGAGTWSWTRAASDEAALQTVTITADDGHGHATTGAFTVTVHAVAPNARIVTDPPEILEGSTEPFTGAATTAFPGDGADLLYSWLVTKNGAQYATGTGATFGLTPDDDGTYVVTFTAKDQDSALSDSESTTVTGINVRPSARITGVSAPSLLVAQESVGFTGNFSDPGVADSHSVVWSFGDGITSSSNFGPGGSANLAASHTYTAAGIYTVTLTVRDDDGGQGQASTTVTV